MYPILGRFDTQKLKDWPRKATSLIDSVSKLIRFFKNIQERAIWSHQLPSREWTALKVCSNRTYTILPHKSHLPGSIISAVTGDILHACPVINWRPVITKSSPCKFHPSNQGILHLHFDKRHLKTAVAFRSPGVTFGGESRSSTEKFKLTGRLYKTKVCVYPVIPAPASWSWSNPSALKPAEHRASIVSPAPAKGFGSH